MRAGDDPPQLSNTGSRAYYRWWYIQAVLAHGPAQRVVPLSHFHRQGDDTTGRVGEMQTPIDAKVNVQLQGFGDFVQATREQWQVPGVAVAVVKDGSVIFSQGFGLRDRTHRLPVTPQTLFPIASCTKAFTCVGLALLADEGKLDWDTPVRSYVPTFALYDPVATERMTPRDLVTHRSGLPRHDLMWYKSPYTRQELFDRLRYLEPSKDFRAVFQYNNLMYMAAGHLIDCLSGQCWEDFTRDRILAPLGMVHTRFSVVEAQQTKDFARPHKEEKEEVIETNFYEEQGAIGPAGAIVSSVAEMSQWVLLQLNGGKHGDRQIVSAGQIAQLHGPQITLPDSGRYAELPPPVTYGLGWSVQSYRGHTILQHSGGINGFSSLVTFLPREQLGVVVLNNLSSLVPFIVTFNAIDRLLGLEEIPWSTRFMKDHLEFKQGGERGRTKSAAEAVPGTQPSHPLKSFTGDFAHAAYGTIAITQEGEGLVALINGVARPLTHYHYDIFELTIEEWDLPIKISFATNVRGEIASIAAPFEPAVPDIMFKRVPGSHMRETSFLEQFVGEYLLMEQPLRVLLKGNHVLVVSLPGQPDYDLEPVRGTEFQLKGLTGFRIEFSSDAPGRVTGALVTQPGRIHGDQARRELTAQLAWPLARLLFSGLASCPNDAAA